VKPGNPPQGTPVEGRGGRIMEPQEGKMTRTSGLESISTKLERIAKQVREAPGMVFTHLMWTTT
jgi:hypothetical protein